MPIALADALHDIEGRSLSSVEFIHDYLQLRFDGPYLTAYTSPVISSECGFIEANHFDYRNRLCAEIGRQVKICSADGDDVSITFEDGVTITISLRDESYRGPEALEFRNEIGERWVV